MKTYFIRLVAMIAGLCLLAIKVHAAGVDHTLFASLLSRHVANGSVDYQGMQNQEAILDRYLEALAAVKPDELPRDEQFAFYVNAYNAWTIKLILSRYPDIGSIKELGSFLFSPWKKKIARIDGDRLSLDQIEHDILRKRFKDPRVHFAVNCASKGCPPLQNEPFTGSRLDEQLNRATTAFINNPRFNRLDGDTLWVSKIFDWYVSDFDDDVVGFFIDFADTRLKSQLAQRADRIRIEYFDYDWSLNGKTLP